ncbi:MAG: GNAT family N-acetyltransferase [Actinobacteria bacterium]|nr:GNAT family N-acetyltransferase [Actinomycetota bacterium]
MTDVDYKVNPSLRPEDLASLMKESWGEETKHDYEAVLNRSYAFVCAYFPEDRLVGFVNLLWDGGAHVFLVDTTVHPDVQRRGIGQTLVKTAISIANQSGAEWVHVDYERYLGDFYTGCGFHSTPAGLIRLR